MEAKTTAVELLRVLAFPRRKGSEATPGAEDGALREEGRSGDLVGFLRRDLKGPNRVEALQGLCGLLFDDGATVAKVLDTVSWEVFGLVLGCLERSVAPASSNRSGASGSRLAQCKNNISVSNGARNSNRIAQTSKETMEDVEDVAALSERVLSEMAEIFSPKELHIMSLEHLHAYSGGRTLRTILTVLQRSTQRMPPVQRAKFLETSIRPALETITKLATMEAAVSCTGASSAPISNDNPSVDRCQEPSSNNEKGEEEGDDVLPRFGKLDNVGEMMPPLADDEVSSRAAAYEACASAAQTVVGFAGPLLEQAYTERALLTVIRKNGIPSSVSSHGEKEEEPTEKSARAEKEAASDLSLAAYLGLVLSGLELAAETSVCTETLARAEERLVELVIGGPAIDLNFVLLHSYRLSYAERAKRRKCGGNENAEDSERLVPFGSLSGGLRVGLGELAGASSLPWTLRGVSSVAYLIACKPKLRDRWLPLVWSRRTERRLFLPHAESLMRDKSNDVASKGLELACFVAERIGELPDDNGSFAFEWESEGEGVRDARGDIKDDNRAVAGNEGLGGSTSEGGSLQQKKTLDPYRFDIVGFLQVLLDVMVSSPLPALRARGHSALTVFLSGTGETSRFRALKRLIDRCPWPNATGLLLDAFRREVDRAFRYCCHQVEEDQPALVLALDNNSRGGSGSGGGSCEFPSTAKSGVVGSLATKVEGQKTEVLPFCTVSTTVAGIISPNAAAINEKSQGAGLGSVVSPFASAATGDFICDQLRRACRKGPPAALLIDMDSRTGGLLLARYAHALDRTGSSSVGGRGGRLNLRDPGKLRGNQLLVQGLLDELRGAAFSGNSAGPDHFRLFILEDAAQQCLQELRVV